MQTPLLRVEHLCAVLKHNGVEVPVLDDIDFTLHRGRTLGIVGESGSGKSMTALALMRLLPKSARVTQGRILFNDEALLAKSDLEMRDIRGGQIAMIFQDPMTSLNPTMSIGEQIAEVVRRHRGVNHRLARARALEMLEMVHISAAYQRLDAYPHELSGGMRQRVMIAMALSCEPALLIADEPTTALDVTIQAQILELMKEMQQRLGMAILLITHDLGVIAETCDDVLVLYGGQTVERASVGEIFAEPRMPYTQGLLASLPRLDDDPTIALLPIEGQPPTLSALPPGCIFAPRCPVVYEPCAQRPPLFGDEGHAVRCWHAQSTGERLAEG